MCTVSELIAYTGGEEAVGYFTVSDGRGQALCGKTQGVPLPYSRPAQKHHQGVLEHAHYSIQLLGQHSVLSSQMACSV